MVNYKSVIPSMEEKGETAVQFGKIFNLMIYYPTLVTLLCCKSHTHAANIKFQPDVEFGPNGVALGV